MRVFFFFCLVELELGIETMTVNCFSRKLGVSRLVFFDGFHFLMMIKCHFCLKFDASSEQFERQLPTGGLPVKRKLSYVSARNENNSPIRFNDAHLTTSLPLHEDNWVRLFHRFVFTSAFITVDYDALQSSKVQCLIKRWFCFEWRRK